MVPYESILSLYNWNLKEAERQKAEHGRITNTTQAVLQTLRYVLELPVVPGVYDSD